MYQVHSGDIESEARQAAGVIERVIDRIQRLGTAYGEWLDFDAGAYFDLHPASVTRLVRISERVNTVHINFYADLLLPAFCELAQFFTTDFVATYRTAHGVSAEDASRTGEAPTGDDGSEFQRFYEITQPTMLECWERTRNTIQATREILAESPGYLMTNGTREEQIHWGKDWLTTAMAGLEPALTPALAEVPTLTLSFDFPLPAYRQPGRIRRLRSNRERRRFRRQSGNKKE